MASNKQHATYRNARAIGFRKTALALALGQALALGAPAAWAATITVDTNSGGTGGPSCTLRDAITAANTDAPTGGCPAGSGTDTIILPTGATISLTGADNPNNGLPVATSTISIQGNGATIQGNNTFRILDINGGSLTIDGTTISGGSADSGGGIRVNGGTLTLTDSTVSGNSAYYGGGISLGGGGTATLTDSTVSGNSAASYGGGGIFVGDGGTATLTDSTVSGNSAVNLGGGGLFARRGTLTLTNSTVSGNSAGGYGGGIYAFASAVTLTNSTVSGNSAGYVGGGIYAFTEAAPASLTLQNTIIANSSNGDCVIFSILATNTNSLVQDGSTYCGTPAFTGDPSLGPLANNGGLTQTHALLAGSLAIDAGSDGLCPAADQRGQPRTGPTAGAHCDIGAFEVQVSPEIDIQGQGQSIATGDATPSTADDTDFGSAQIGGAGVPHTFTIANTGTATLTLSGTPRVTLTGATGDFTVTVQPATATVAGGSTTTFTVRFNPTAAGTRQATVSIANDDSDENPYTFTIQGNGTAAPAPEIDIQGQGQSIVAGDATPSTADDTDFGSAQIGGAGVPHTFTIANTGTATLTLSGTPRVTLTGATGDFTVTVQPATATVAGGSTTTFTVRFNPTAAGTRQATVSIANDDSDENPYTFTIQGNGVVANHPPTADDDSYGTPRDQPLTVALPGALANDSDPDGDPLTAIKLTDPAHGTVALNPDGSFTYTPNPGYVGPDSFTYKVNDGHADSNAATVNLTVSAVAEIPTLSEWAQAAAAALLTLLAWLGLRRRTPD